jgi:3alpha(or 20beta)-hydroxysteroid dehydrogenase
VNRFEGKVALVTGGARGLGAATVRRLHSEGASVVAADILDDDGKALADELGDRVRFVHLDVTSEDQWQDVVAQTEREFGKLDVLVNNAGILKFNALIDTPLEEFRQVLDVNLVGVFLGMKHAIPAMKRAGAGAIVNIYSTAGDAATRFCGAYTASKFGVRGITKAAALEYAGDNIRANSVHPGGMDTPMTRAVMDETGRKYVASKVPLKRMGTPEDVANAVAFLASEDASYMTGGEVLLDGGVMSNVGF